MGTSGPIGVVGLGLLGRGIAASLLGAGFPVLSFDVNRYIQFEARAYIETAIAEMVSHNVLSQPSAASWLERYQVCESLDSFTPCTFVIESVTEDLAAKRQVFDELEAIVGTHVPIASNTSALPIKVLQKGRKYPERFLGMHWAEPAYATRFLEIIRGEQTSDAAVSLTMELGRAVGKDPCTVSHDLPGFLVNRLAYAMYREAAYLLELGVADVETIDRAFCNACGLWATFCGPLRWIDITGGPALYAKVMTEILPSLNNSAELPAIFAQKERDGESGTRDCRGFYSYEASDGERWQKLFHEHVWQVRRLQEKYFPLDKERSSK